MDPSLRGLQVTSARTETDGRTLTVDVEAGLASTGRFR
jgi:hypothetical protein